MWEIDRSYSIYNETNEHYAYQDYVNVNLHFNYIIYKGTDVWSLRNGRCRPITTARFEKRLRKALKLAREKGHITSDGAWRLNKKNGYFLVGVCKEYLNVLKGLGLYMRGDFVVPEKFTDGQIAFAIKNYWAINERIVAVEEYYGNRSN
jgi:hypothetical protein